MSDDPPRGDLPQVRPPRVPATIVYGPKPPKISLRLGRTGWQTYFCAVNENLHLNYDTDFVEGTFTTEALLEPLCRAHCVPTRGSAQPCPAFIRDWTVQKDKPGSLAGVTLQEGPRFEECAGVQHLLQSCDTDDERDFLVMYLNTQPDRSDLAVIAKGWNENWWHVRESGWLPGSRRAKFDRLMWANMRRPALIPQVWLHWLGEASDEDRKLLDASPSRVDFVALHAGRRFVIEIDGPSHYAHFDGQSYKVDEDAATRTLKYDRSLRSLGWEPIHIGRKEVRDAKRLGQEWNLVSILSFVRAGEPPTAEDFGMPPHVSFDYDLIPF